VSNGKELVLFDQDLEQVTVYDSESALKSSPTMIFRDPEALERSFEMRSLKSDDGLAWVELTPNDGHGGARRRSVEWGSSWTLHCHDRPPTQPARGRRR